MADNLWQTNTEDQLNPQKTEESFSAVPPPPEVKARTMRSDLEEMAKGGGTLPNFQTIKAPQLAVIARDEGLGKKKMDWFLIAVPILAIALVGGIVYFAYQVFGGDGGRETVNTGMGGVSSEPITPATGIFSSGSITHASLLRKPADELFNFISRGSAESASELQTFGQRLLSVVSASNPGSKFLEIRFQDDSGRDLLIDEILSLSDALVLPADFLLQKFNPDPTVFVYSTEGKSSFGGKDNRSFWPGYILQLKIGENWLFLKGEISRLEFSLKIENFFLKFPGNREGAGFEDVVIDSQPARRINFSSGASFLYGWFRGKLILSASEDGLKEALARL